MFQRAVVDDELDDVAAEAKVEHQGRRLGRRPETRDAFSLGLERVKEVAQLKANLLDLLAEGNEGCLTVQPRLGLLVEQALYRRKAPRSVGNLGDSAQASPVGIDELGPDQLHAVTSKERNQRAHAVVAEVLVIDRVEQCLLDHVRQVGHLEHEAPVARQQQSHRFNDAGEIVDVREYVVRSDAFRRTHLSPDAVAHLRVEKRRPRGNPCCRGLGGDLLGGVNPQNLHAAALEEAQQRAVVGADVDHQVAGTQADSGDHGLRVALEVAHEDGRGPGNVHVVGEQLSRVDDVEQLNVTARPAKPYVERVGRLRLVHLVGRDKRIGRRCWRQRQNLSEVATPTQTA